MLSKEYQSCDTYKCKYVGLLFGEEKFKEYLTNKIRDKYFDKEGTMEISEYAIEITGFKNDMIMEKLKNVLKSQVPLENWRIGEVVAESVLEDEFNIRFYYDSMRDAKNMQSNPSGADLIGFTEVDRDTVFVFGEVKTSSEEKYPPNILYGRTGMIKQLESLKLLEKKRDELVRWITFKSKYIGGELRHNYKRALIKYIYGSKEKVKLVGVLIRDTQPNEKDLKNRAKVLGANKPSMMDIELIALYSNYRMECNQWINCLQEGEVNNEK